jgi:hypothetical protein
MKFELKKLMLEGCFGSIRLGNTPQKVVHLLGFPKGYHVKDRSMKRHEILKNSPILETLGFQYGSIEFWFSFGELIFLYSDHFDRDLKFRSERYFDPWVLRHGLCIKDFLNILNQEKIEYSVFQNTMIDINDGLGYRIYLSENTHVSFSSEIHTIGSFDGEKWINEIWKPPCVEISSFYLVKESRKPEEFSFLQRVNDIEELLL